MEKKLGLSALTALVLSSMLGAGVFSLPQNMAAVASPSALLIGWAITGVGILFLAFAMLLLTRIRPDLDGGIFTYAREGFGELIGFCSAWGYWLCAVIANVSYLVIVFSALSFFTDTPELRLFGDGNTGSLSLALRFCCGLSIFWSCAACRRRRGLTWWPPSPNSCRWARLSRSPPGLPAGYVPPRFPRTGAGNPRVGAG
ncbi:amino acid permease [Klebsiella variicola subsp. variicola]|nr:amino acid permease [Klebsiella variicola subsp. variicola]